MFNGKNLHRRKFLTSSSALAAGSLALGSGRPFAARAGQVADDRTFATPNDAQQSPRETLAYVVATYAGTKTSKPDYLAAIDVDPTSRTFSQVVARVVMPNVGDELHHFGWNACASCHGVRARRFLIVPGLGSGRIHVIDTADPRQPKLHKVIEPESIAAKTKLSTPHTVHCLADGSIMISMLGDEKGDGPGGFLLLDESFEVAGRWEVGANPAMKYNYDFWYQPRLNVMVSSEWAAPNTVKPGFKLEDVQAGKYGQRLHFWDWQRKRLVQSIDLGEKGRIPLEIRFHHAPESSHGFVGAALSSVVWHFHQPTGSKEWKADPVIEVEARETKGWPFPVPGLITDLVLSLDDRWLYFADWLHGDVRQYDVADPAKPKLTGQIWLGGVLDDRKPVVVRGKTLTGGPQMLQLSLDGKRLYVTNSLFSSWDNQFYPAIANEGSHLVMIDCDNQRGGMTLNPNLLVDFGREPDGPARAHEIRFPNGDSTSDIWH